jgi:hypothetical protein
MKIGKKVIEIFQGEKGEKPFIDWLKSIKDKKTVTRILAG